MGGEYFQIHFSKSEQEVRDVPLYPSCIFPKLHATLLMSKDMGRESQVGVAGTDAGS